MTTLQIVAAVILLTGAIIFISGVIYIISNTERTQYKRDLAPIKRSPSWGVLWAFSLGLMPWSKQSARIHWLAYLRGAIFHICIFVAVVFLLGTPWLSSIPAILRSILFILFICGAVLMLFGIVIRLRERTLKLLSTYDDYFALIIVTLFLATASLASYSIEYLTVFWIVSGLTLAYAPFGKLRHFIYFFYARFFLGTVFGRRGVLE